MTVQQQLASIVPPSGTVTTIGTFDGVHLGHQQLIKKLVAEANQRGLVPVVVTFRNHPRSVLRPSAPLSYITDLDTRLRLLSQMGVQHVACVDFTQELSHLSAREFISLLVSGLKMKGLVAGPDFALGRNREGDIDVLRRLGSEMGFWVEAVPPFYLDARPVKSSLIREALAQGDITTVEAMMGRRYFIRGIVVEGDKRGRTLGFPTANVSTTPDLALPGDGIYATWAMVGEEQHCYRSATSIGIRPTFGGKRRTVEAYLMDFDGDLYGQRLTLEFAARLRGEMAFPSAQALIEQMHRDVEQSHIILIERGRAG